MVFLIAIGAYLLLLVLACLFLRGGAIRECPKPHPADIDFDSLQQPQPEMSVVTAAFEPDNGNEWGGDLALPTRRLAQPHL
jgi:hypothetical protein